MFGIGRRKSQGQLARAELNRSVNHLRHAAAYASRGVGQSVGPRVQAARVAMAPTAVLVRDRAVSGWGTTVATLAPLVAAARSGGTAQTGVMTRKAKGRNMLKPQKKRRRGGLMTGLLAAGAVAGMAGAMALRRRRDQQEWAEYDPAQGMDDDSGRTLAPMRDEVETFEVRTPATSRAETAARTGATTGAGTATGAGSSAVAAAGGSAPPTKPVAPNSGVPSVAEGARTVAGRPADDLSKAMGGASRPDGARH